MHAIGVYFGVESLKGNQFGAAFLKEAMHDIQVCALTFLHYQIDPRKHLYVSLGLFVSRKLSFVTNVSDVLMKKITIGGLHCHVLPHMMLFGRNKLVIHFGQQK